MDFFQALEAFQNLMASVAKSKAMSASEKKDLFAYIKEDASEMLRKPKRKKS